MAGFGRKSFSNLAALAQGDYSEAELGTAGSLHDLQGGGPLSLTHAAGGTSRNSIDSDGRRLQRCVGLAGPRHAAVPARHRPVGAAGPGLAGPMMRPPRPPPRRLIFVSNHLPLKVSKGTAGWNFEWDEDALIAQAREGIPEEMEALYVGCLPVEVEHNEQDVSWLGRCESGAAVRRRCSGTRRGCGLWNGGCKTAAAGGHGARRGVRPEGQCG